MLDWQIRKNFDVYYNYAESIGSFVPLVFSPYLLFRWQSTKLHKQDMVRIATIASHQVGDRINRDPAIAPEHRLHKGHHWCTSQEKCRAVELFIQQHSNPVPLEIIEKHFQKKLVKVLERAFYKHHDVR